MGQSSRALVGQSQVQRIALILRGQRWRSCAPVGRAVRGRTDS